MKFEKRVKILLLSLVLLTGFFLRAYKLSEESFFRDEFFELNSSYGYFKTGEWLAWDFGNNQPIDREIQNEYSNTRAQIYRIQLALLYHFQEPTETVTRALSVFWGEISIILIFFFTFSLTGSIPVSLLSALMFAISSTSVVLDRRLRMYSMFLPTYLAFVWTVFQFYESKYSGKISFFREQSEKLGINLNYLIPATLLGLVSLELHELTISVAFVLLPYCLVLSFGYFRKQEYVNKYSLTLGLMIIGFLFVENFLKSLSQSFDRFVRFFKFNSGYFQYFLDDWHWPWLFGGLMIWGGYSIYRKFGRTKEALFIISLAFGPLLFAVLSWANDPVKRYLYFILPYGIILAAAGIMAVAEFVSGKFKKGRNFLKIAIIVGFIFFTKFWYLYPDLSIYRQRTDVGHYDFNKLFSFVIRSRQPEDVMITRIYRSYYWRDSGIKVFDIKSLDFDQDACESIFSKIIQENKSGWVVYPEIDQISICSSGQEYLEKNMMRIKSPEIPEAVFVYRWGKDLTQR